MAYSSKNSRSSILCIRMLIPSYNHLFSPRSAAFWLLCGSIFFGLLVFAFIFDISPLVAPAVTLILASLPFLRSPLGLLAILVTIRMSLDYLSETFPLSFGGRYSFSLSQTLGGVLLVLSISLFVSYRRLLRSYPLILPFAILIGYGFFSTANSVAPTLGLQEIARLISIFAIGFLSYLSVRDSRDIGRIFLILIFSSVIPIIESLRQLILGIGIADSSFDVLRIFGTFAHTNVLALYLYSVCVTIVLLYLASRNTRGEYWRFHPSLFAYGILVIALLGLTYTRIAWIAFFVFVLGLSLWRYRILLIPLVALPLVAFSLSATVRERVIESFQTNPDSSIIWRQEIWHDVTTKLRMDHAQVFGTGLDTFSLYAENLRGVRFGSTDSHNDFVKFYVEGGLVGLTIFIIYLSLLGKALRPLFRLPPEYRSLAFVFTLYAFTLLISSFSDNIHKDTPIQWFFFILFGALLSLKRHFPEDATD